MESILRKLSISQDKGYSYLTQLFKAHGVIAYAVGGAVRDCILEEEISDFDIDIAVPCCPADVKVILRNGNIQSIDIGIDYGTVIAVIDSKNYEITSFRKDIKTDGRHTLVTYGHDIAQDAKRRDFTINALYYQNHGVILDPTGLGLEDIQKKYIRFIGDAHQRIQEDYLRILRYFRFLTRFGIDNFNPEIFHKQNYAPFLEKISRERISKEIQQLFFYDDAVLCLDILSDIGYLPVIFQNLVLDKMVFSGMHKITRDIRWLLGALFYKNSEKEIKNAFKLSNKTTKEIEKFKKLFNVFSLSNCLVDLKKIHSLKYEYPQYLYDIICQYFMCIKPELTNFYQKLLSLPILKVEISGKQLLEQGYQSGSEIGNILREQKEKLIEQQFITHLKDIIS